MTERQLTTYSGIVWLAEGRGQERFSILAESWEDAVSLIRQQYGSEQEFTLTDEVAARRPR